MHIRNHQHRYALRKEQKKKKEREREKEKEKIASNFLNYSVSFVGQFFFL
jgi:hypothetical protein